MNSHLVPRVHLVELVDTTDAVICEEQRPGLDDELSALLVPHHGGRQTGGTAGLPAGVDGPGTEVGHDLEELRLGGAGVAHHADVDVAPQTGPAGCGLAHPTKQHQSDPSLHLVVAVNCGEEAVDDVAVEVLVLAHVVDALPLVRSHLGLHLLRCRLLVAIGAELGDAARADTAGQERHPVVKVSHAETLQSPHSLRLLAAVTVAGLGLGPGQVDHSHVRDDDQTADKLAPVAGLGGVHGLGPQDDVDTAGDAAAGQLGLDLLDSHLLEVNKLGLVEVQHEPRAVVADRVPAGGRLGELELLLDALHHGLAVQALEGSLDQLGVDWVSPDHLPRDLGQGPDLDGGQLSHLNTEIQAQQIRAILTL